MNFNAPNECEIAGRCVCCGSLSEEEILEDNGAQRDDLIIEGSKAWRVELGHAQRHPVGEHIIFIAALEEAYFDDEDIFGSDDPTSYNLYMHQQCYESLHLKHFTLKEPTHCSCCGDPIVGLQNVELGGYPEMCARLTFGIASNESFEEDVPLNKLPDKYLCVNCAYTHLEAITSAMDNTMDYCSNFSKQESDMHPNDEILYSESDNE